MMKELEAEAHTAYWASPGAFHDELVAIGLVELGDGDADISWWQLENSAVANADGRGEFFVEPTDLFPVLHAVAEHAGLLRLGDSISRGIDELLRSRVLILWHTHVGSVSPSAEDIAEFPSWLVDYGMVYHVPSDTTTVYNAAGIISKGHESNPSLATVSDG